jgi:hypothetical protein
MAITTPMPAHGPRSAPCTLAQARAAPRDAPERAAIAWP